MRFGVFELDIGSGELRKSGVKVRLQEQPFQVLKTLAEKPGEVVSREELQEQLWSDETFVDFEDGLSTAIRKVRSALGDSASNPRFIETLPKRGYRFIAPVAKPPAAGVAGRKLWYAGAAAAALVLGVAGSRLTGPSAPEPEAMLSAVPLTSFEGQEQDATFSPDGNQVAFAWNGPNQDNFDIYVQVVGSPSPPLRLTSDPATDVAPAWSPDGRRIAFVRAVGERNTVRLISPLGGPDRELAEFVFGYFYVSRFPTLAWLPDADSLLAAGNESTNEPAAIYSLSAATGEKVRLTSPTAGSLGDQRSAVSPDGNTVAFVRYASPAAPAQIHLMPSQGGEPKLLARHNSIQGVTWLPHGREIVFSSGSYAQSHTRRLWRIAVGGGDPRLLAGIGENASKPVVAPNGNRLVFERSVFDPNIWRYELEGSSNQPRKLIASTRAERSVQLSPDGKRIAFFSQRSGSSEIWVAGSDGSNPIQLTSFSGPSAGSPRWSPDGQSIAFDSNLQGSWDVYVVNAQGGAPRAVAVGEGEESRPSWSRDGQWIYFNSDRGGTHQIYRIPVQGGEPVRVSQAGGYNPFESPDGRFVYYGRGPMEAGLWRIPAEGGDEEAVLPGLGGVAVGRGCAIGMLSKAASTFWTTRKRPRRAAASC